MAIITTHGGWTGSENASASWRTLAHRIRVQLRAHRFARHRAARMRHIWSEMRDPRWIEDVGVDPRGPRRYDWLSELVRAKGGR